MPAPSKQGFLGSGVAARRCRKKKKKYPSEDEKSFEICTPFHHAVISMHVPSCSDHQFIHTSVTQK
jgi:hypothetical protein